jgi:hypothetical protein
MIGKAMGVAIVAAALAAPVWADDHVASAAIEQKALVSGKAKIDPAKGYIFFHGPARLTMMLLKTPSEAQSSAFEADWKEALDKAKKKYPKQLEAWQRNAEYAKTHDGVKAGDKPIEPTEQTFSIGDIETRMTVSVGPLFAFAKSDADISYLEEVEPGTYTLYGPILVAPNAGGSGLCYCMGSVKFDVVAGKITNLGNFAAVHGFEQVVDIPEKNDRPTEENWDLPPSLEAFPSVRADLHAAGKMNNFYGAMVGRMAPVPGVLGYERDKVIDLKASPLAGATE